MPQWTAEREVSEDDARALIGAQFPALAHRAMVRFGHGWDNTAYLVDDTYVFRFPRRAIAGPLLANEIAVLPLLAPALPAPIPVPRFVGTPSSAFPWPFAGYVRIDGTTACAPSVQPSRLLAQQLGTFLRALHAIDPEPARAEGLAGDQIGRLDHTKRFRMSVERFAALQADGAIGDPAPFLDFLERVAPRSDEASPRVVHGDLYARHVVVGEDGTLAGVIDWGDLHLGDPALDLAVGDLLFDDDDLATFLTAYGQVDPRTNERARY
ncbi:MAG: phosphotransferase, partial [Vulcanimicrobiaceae bacterium]